MGHMLISYIPNDLFIYYWMFLFKLKSPCELWPASFISKQTLRLLFRTTWVETAGSYNSHVKAAKQAITIYKLQSCAYIVAQLSIRKATNLYHCTKHHDAFFVQAKTNHDFWFTIQSNVSIHLSCCSSKFSIHCWLESNISLVVIYWKVCRTSCVV